MLRETMVERDNLYDQANNVSFSYIVLTPVSVRYAFDNHIMQFMDKNDRQKQKIAALREEIDQLMVSGVW